MNFERSSGAELLPDIEPETLGPDARRLFNDAEGLTRDRRKTLFWSLRLMQERERVHAAAARISGAGRIAFGFLDPEYEADAFGVIILASLPMPPGADQRDIELAPLRIDGRTFPIVVRRLVESLHAPLPSPQPIGGTAGLWARSRIGAIPIGPGLLTAKHVTGHRLGTPTPLTCGCTGSVIDVAPPCIDASLIECTCSAPSSLARIPAMMAVAATTAVEFEGNATGAPITTVVTATTDLLSIYTSPELPITVLLAVPGAHGDSGAAVLESTAGGRPQAIGVYRGGYKTSAGAVGGFAQHIGQACKLMDMELFL